MSVLEPHSGDLTLPGEGPNRFRSLLAANLPWPLVIAHRGDSSRAPENTLEAARLGWDAGADAWELDVQLSRDGFPVVVHDESLLRTTNVGERFAGDSREATGFLVSHFDLEEIRGLDAGSWFVHPQGGLRTALAFGTRDTLAAESRNRYASGAVRIPTLREALELTRSLGWLVNVELKSVPNTNPRLVDAVLAVIDETGTASRVLISSFDHADVARVARERPEIATGALVSTPLHRPADYVRQLVGADAYHPSTTVLGAGSDAYLRQGAPSALRPADLASLKAQHVAVLVYTVNDVAANGLAEHLAEAGVQGLFSDYPGLLRKRFDARSGSRTGA